MDKSGKSGILFAWILVSIFVIVIYFYSFAWNINGVDYGSRGGGGFPYVPSTSIWAVHSLFFHITFAFLILFYIVLSIMIFGIYKRIFMRIFVFLPLIIIIVIFFINIVNAKPPANDITIPDKPVIYLYPQEETQVSVKLDFDGILTCTYPAYNNGWNVEAYPDGTIINDADNQKYSYLFWEGESNTQYDFSKGFVVAGADTTSFLQQKLSYMGLMPKEYNEFIVYWLPQMQNNAYNLITFQGADYTNSAKLDISPTPDSVLRVFMAYKPLKEKISLQEEPLQPFVRKGFTVVEWGGTEVK